MKNLPKLILTLMFIPISLSSCNKKINEYTSLEVKSLKNEEKKPLINLAQHEDKDVELYKSSLSHNSNFYKIIFYKDENDTLKHFQVLYGAEEDYSFAYYKWEKDTLKIRLSNTDSGNETNFKLWGKGSVVGMGVLE